MVERGGHWRTPDAATRLARQPLGGSRFAAEVALFLPAINTRLLAQRRDARNKAALPRVTEAEILAWADAYRARSGRWPSHDSGPIPEAPGETWKAVALALVQGLRGLPGADSLDQLLRRKRGKPERGGARRWSLKSSPGYNRKG